MNTICIQLNEQQLSDLEHLLDEGLDLVSSKPSEGDYSEEDLAEIMRLCGDGITEIRRAIQDRTYLWSSGCGHLELDIPAQAVDDIARPACDNEPATKAWLEGEESNYLRAQVERLDLNDIRTFFDEAGIEDVRSKSEAECRELLLWTACHDVRNEKSQRD